MYRYSKEVGRFIEEFTKESSKGKRSSNSPFEGGKQGGCKEGKSKTKANESIKSE